MNLAWTFGDFVSPKQVCCLLQKDRLDPRLLQKHLAISPIPLPFVAAP
jgi:hypothetical protein